MDTAFEFSGDHEQPPPRPIAIKWLGEDENSLCEVSGGSPALIDERPVERDGRSSDREMDVIERDGKRISVPRYTSGRNDDCVEGEVATPAVLIEHQCAIVPEPVASTPTLPEWTGPYPPPPLVAHLYAPFVPSRGRAVGR